MTASGAITLLAPTVQFTGGAGTVTHAAGACGSKAPTASGVATRTATPADINGAVTLSSPQVEGWATPWGVAVVTTLVTPTCKVVGEVYADLKSRATGAPTTESPTPQGAAVFQGIHFLHPPWQYGIDATLRMSRGAMTLRRDDAGRPHYLYRLQRSNYADYSSALSDVPLSAFYVDGDLVDEVWVGAYLASEYEGGYATLPGAEPALCSFDTARTICEGMGEGWRLLSRHTWAALALESLGAPVRGNTNFGSAHDAPSETGTVVGGMTTLTGTGPATWRHNQSAFGVADLVGNYFEWNAGVALADGWLYAAMGDVRGQDSLVRVAGLDTEDSPQWTELRPALLRREVTTSVDALSGNVWLQRLLLASLEGVTDSLSGSMVAINWGRYALAAGGYSASGADAGLLSGVWLPPATPVGAFRTCYVEPRTTSEGYLVGGFDPSRTAIGGLLLPAAEAVGDGSIVPPAVASGAIDTLTPTVVGAGAVTGAPLPYENVELSWEFEPVYTKPTATAVDFEF